MGDWMIRISLCDDNAVLIHRLGSSIGLIRDDIEIFSYTSGEELLNSDFLYNDIVILDIEMEGIDGIETAKRLRSDGYEGIVIFATSHKEMVFDSFQVNPFQYIVKPIDVKEFNTILEKAISNLIDKRNRHFEAVSNNQTYRILLSDIYFFESQGRKIEINTKSGIVVINGRMNQIETSLRSKYFFRCHKGYLVNLEQVYAFSDNEITLSSHKKIPVSRLKYNLFRETFKAFMKGNRKW